MSVSNTWKIMQEYRNFPSWAPVWLLLGKICQSGLWQESAEFSISKEKVQPLGKTVSRSVSSALTSFSFPALTNTAMMGAYRDGPPVMQAEPAKGKQLWDRKGGKAVL